MGKRRSRKEKQLEAQISSVLLLVALLIFNWTKSIGQTIGTLIILISLTLVFLTFRAQRQKQILRNSGIKEIDKMDGIQFEYYLKELYTSLGFSVSVTKSSGDFGADLILNNNGRKIVVQAKRYTNNVGVKAIQEVKAAQSHYNAIESWVVTNSYFTKAAVTLAKSNDVKLVNRDQLINQILLINKNG